MVDDTGTVAKVVSNATQLGASIAGQAAFTAGRAGGNIVGSRIRTFLIQLTTNAAPRSAKILLDQFFITKMSSAVFPATLTLVVVLALSAAAGPLLGSRTALVLVGCALLLSACWGVYAIVRGIFGLSRYAFRLLSNPRLPRRFLEDEISAELTKLIQGAHDEAGDLLKGFLHGAGVTPKGIAEQIAVAALPAIMRHLLLRLVLLIAPLAAALAYFRFVLYPGIVSAGFGYGPATLAMYPLALGLDLLTGSQHATKLLSGG